MIARVLVVFSLASCSLVADLDEPNDLVLEGLAITPGVLSPRFDPAITRYEAALPLTGDVTIVATPSNGVAQVAIDGLVTSEQAVIQVRPGRQTIRVSVTSPTGLATTYTIDATIAGLQFEPEKQTTLLGTVEDVTSADVDRDGNVDLVVGQNTGYQIALGNGDGTFRVGPIVAGPRTTGIAVGDIDADTQLDVALAQNGNLQVARGRGDGTFDVAQNISPVAAIEVAIGELTGDTHADLAVTGTASVQVFAGASTTSFTELAPFPIDANPRSLALYDAAGTPSTVQDLVAVHPERNRVSLLRNSTNGINFAVMPLDFTAPVAVVPIEMNDDDRVDLALAFGTRAGTHYTPTQDTLPDLFVELGSPAVALAAADLDGAGAPELVVVTMADLVILFDGSIPVHYPIEKTHAVLAGDFNNDGQGDIALVMTGKLGVMLGVKP